VERQFSSIPRTSLAGKGARQSRFVHLKTRRISCKAGTGGGVAVAALRRLTDYTNAMEGAAHDR
jgi:hypothetical protein